MYSTLYLTNVVSFFSLSYNLMEKRQTNYLKDDNGYILWSPSSTSVCVVYVLKELESCGHVLDSWDNGKSLPFLYLELGFIIHY